MNKTYIDKLSRIFEKSQIGKIRIDTPDSGSLVFEGVHQGENCDITIKDWKAIDLVIKRGDIGLGEAYCEGLWESSDISSFLIFCSKNIDYLRNGSANFFNRLLFYVYNNYVKLNTKYGSKKNIIDHYDIGNDFYSMWIDSTMTYSSALRANDNDNLVGAQINKYKRIIDTLSLAGKNVLEIGCGWGGFADQAANIGADVTGITISNNQYSFAKTRLGNKAQILLQDYRDINKKYDSIVSIEMFEAVGEKYWPIYFDTIKKSLVKGGKALIQTITICDDAFNNYRKDSDYIRHYIFPGGMLPSMKRFCEEAQKARLNVDSVLEFGDDYAWTLRQWLSNFIEIKDKLLSMNHSISFLRAWEFYLNMCIAGFESKRTNVMQVEISN